MASEILRLTDRGLYCDPGGFYIDPWKPVDRAVVTHAHSDHACYGCRHYLGSVESRELFRLRLPRDSEFQLLEDNEPITIGGVRVSLHAAGHILGSVMVRLEHRGYVALITGDYKLGNDLTCRPWQPQKCHLMVTESTFGLPIYRWEDQQVTFDSINDWWRRSASEGKCCLLYGYAVGKSQRLLSGLDSSIGPIYTHGAVEKANEAYRAAGVVLPETKAVSEISKGTSYAGSMVVAVPSAHGTPWMRRFGDVSTAMASGWMTIRGARRRRAVDRGFVLSDHADWPGLIEAVKACEPEDVWVTHGCTAIMAKHLQSMGYRAVALSTRYGNEEQEQGNAEG
jgi:putative mRNA 3-end processing factor